MTCINEVHVLISQLGQHKWYCSCPMKAVINVFPILKVKKKSKSRNRRKKKKKPTEASVEPPTLSDGDNSSENDSHKEDTKEMNLGEAGAALSKEHLDALRVRFYSYVLSNVFIERYNCKGLVG